MIKKTAKKVIYKEPKNKKGVLVAETKNGARIYQTGAKEFSVFTPKGELWGRYMYLKMAKDVAENNARDLPVKKNPVKKPATKKNPIKQLTERKINHAVELFKKFRGESPEFIDKVKVPEFGNVAFVIGDLEGVMYRTRRDGKIEHYIHRFDKAAQPILISNHNGTQIMIIGGKYNFTEDGIVDKKK